jgi:hypothetical protein
MHTNQDLNTRLAASTVGPNLVVGPNAPNLGIVAAWKKAA